MVHEQLSPAKFSAAPVVSAQSCPDRLTVRATPFRSVEGRAVESGPGGRRVLQSGVCW